MKFLQLTWFHFKRLVFNDYGLLLISFIFPLVIISGLIFVFTNDSGGAISAEDNFQVVNQSDFVTDNIYPQLSENYQTAFTQDEEAAFEQLDQVEISMVYVIPEDFSVDQPNIKVYSLNGTNKDVLFQSEFVGILAEYYKEDTLNSAGIEIETVEVANAKVTQSYVLMDEMLMITIFMTLFFAAYTTAIIAGDLSKLRKSRVLTRSIVSNAKSWQILGSILSASALYNFLAGLLIILIIATVFSLSLSHSALILSLLFAFSIFNSGLTMFLFRILKNEAVIQIVGILISMVLVFTGINLGLLPESLEFIQYLSPFYWMFEAMDTGQIIPNIPIIILYGLVLFTAGSFKIEKIVKA